MIKLAIIGATELNSKLRRMTGTSEKMDNVSASVGFSAPYAIHVHENLEAFHPVGQAKFLEQPAREREKDIARVAVKLKQQGKPTALCLLAAAMYLQRMAQELCPVLTGYLKGSAFTRADR